MTHGSLFSGIGGFDLAAEWMGWENVFHCEWNKFGQQVLHYYFPKAICYEDITKTDFTIHRGTIDILTGGFPCQPYSSAGKRLGKEDERHLWPEMLRAIREIRPRWIVGENVRGLTNWNGGMVFDEVQSDLEAEGYEVTPFLLPACAVNAPHRRDRIWFVAFKNTNENGWRSKQREEKSKEWEQWHTCSRNNERIRANNEEVRDAYNTNRNGLNECNGDNEVNSSKAGVNATPSSYDWNTAQTVDKYKERKQMQEQKGVNLHYPLKQMVMDINPTGKTSQLSPQFVMEMMGFPTDWTLLPFLNGETSPSKQEATQ